MKPPLESLPGTVKRPSPAFSWSCLGFLVLLLLVSQAAAAAGPAQVGDQATPGISLEGPQEYITEGMRLMAEKDWDGLGEVTAAGLARYPDDAELNCLKGYQLRKTGNFTGAVDHVTIGIRFDPKPVRYANRAYAYLALGRNADALQDADTAISLNSSYTTAYAVRATGLLKTGDLAGAQVAVDTAVALEPSNPVCWHILGRVLAARGNCTGAREAFMTSLSINPDYDLPWPGYGNATEDLTALETTCHAAVPSPTRAALPPLAAGVAVLAAGAVLGVLSARRR